MKRLHSLMFCLPLLSLAAFACGDDEAPDENGTPPPTQAELVARGDYLVNHVAACPDCHTPRNMDGSLDMDNFMAGAECFVDADPANGVGCLNTPNLTNDETGLMNRSDEEIKDMFLEGERPDGDYLFAVMPYWIFGNMTDQDADAIVAYLRTVDGIDHETPDNEAPFDERPPAAANRIDLDLVPMPVADYENQESAMRGRYLAAQAGVCIECHTKENPPTDPDPLQLDMAFAGGREFPLGPGFIATSANITPDATGIEDYTVDDIVRVLHDGLDREDEPICPPMPVGPMGAFGGLTDSDAEDIANYLLSLPPIENDVEDCSLMMPPPGGGGGGAGGPSGEGGAGGSPASTGGAGGSGGA